MSDKVCALCGQKIGAMHRKIELSDGYVHGKCLLNYGIDSFDNHLSFSCNSLLAFAQRKSFLLQSFTPTKRIGSFLSVDNAHKTFQIEKDLFEFKNLVSFELVENGQTVSKGGLGRAAAGGLLFGGAGAVVGAVTGHKSNNICTSMMIHLTLKNAQTDFKRIVILPYNSKFKVGGFTYNAAQTSAQNCLSALQLIADSNQSDKFTVRIPEETSHPLQNSHFSTADEIMRFKQLFDNGVITQDEFEAKKKQLLGL